MRQAINVYQRVERRGPLNGSLFESAILADHIGGFALCE